MATEGPKNIVVVGAGVVGLTTAAKIQEQGKYAVTIVAETFPTDPKTIRYTSLWAGAHHVSHADGDPKQQKIDEDTFKVMWDMSAPGGEAEGCFLRLHQTDYYYDGRDTHLDWMPDHKKLPENSLIPGAKTGCTFTTVTIDTYLYTNYLLSRFLSKGGRIVRASVQHLSQIAEGGPQVFTYNPNSNNPPADGIVVCAGLGARSLGGVEDKDVYPVRGQIALIRAPWIKFGRTSSNLEDGVWTYIIPRRCGDVILGGTKLDNDWYPVARRETTLEILDRCLKLCPELLPSHLKGDHEPTGKDLLPLLLEEGCGFRPSRKGGIRLDVDSIDSPKGKVPVVFNYGHGGGGFQSSWGTADIALGLLEKALDTKEEK